MSGNRFWNFLLGRVATTPTATDRFVRLDAETNETQVSTWAQILTALDTRFAPFGSGAVDSVNGATGVVVLDAADVGADPTGSAAAAQAAAQAASQPLDADLTTIAAANNGTVLAATTAAFTTADETKLDGIEAGATDDQTAAEILTAIKTVDGTGSGLDADTVDGIQASAFLQTVAVPADITATGTPDATTYLRGDGSWATPAGGGGGAVDSVNGATGVVVLDPDDLDDAATAHKFTSAAEISKLAGIEAGADVTSTANVTAAGALMDSEVDADIKTLSLPPNTTISTFAQTLLDDTSASFARSTLSAQALNSDLTAISGTGKGSALAALSAFGAALIDDADASAARTTLGLGTGATATIANYLPLVAGGASVENIGAVEENVQTVAATGATETLDVSTYGVFDMTMDQACEFTFSNPAPSGKATSFVLILRGAFTPTLPASVDWSGGSAPTYTTPSVYTFTTVDGGTIWLGSQAGAGFA